jgi:putative transferase (TIGR04331 family)
MSRIYTRQAKNSAVQVGLYGAFFSQLNISKLILQTRGLVNIIRKISKDNISKQKKDLEVRSVFSQHEVDFDRFDQFFFKSMESLFPSILLEDFQAATNEVGEHFKSYRNLKYLVGEAWIGDTIDSIALAYMRRKNVKHVYNEHNALFYPFTGTMVELRARLVDTYYTMGWEDKKIPNLVPGASLFEFTIRKNKEVKYPITLISNVRFAKIPEYSAVYGFCAENVGQYVQYMKAFLSALGQNVKSKILYRGPRSGYEGLNAYNNEFLLEPFYFPTTY